jgi:xanthine/uracil/vitamin C permease (AzgA family)
LTFLGLRNAGLIVADPVTFEKLGKINLQTSLSFVGLFIMLYFLVKKNEPITSLKMWEYTSFGKSQVVKKWDVNDEYFLYKLEKKI